MISRAGKYFEQIDRFGVPIKLNIYGKEKSQTKFGAFLTLGMLGLTAIVFYSQITLYISTFNLITNTQQNFSEDPELLTFSAQNFTFAVAIEQTYNSIYVEQPYFLIEINQTTSLNQDENEHSSRIDLVPCNLDMFQNIFEKDITEQYQRLNLSHYLCPKADYSFQLQGSRSSDIFKYLRIKIRQCDESKMNPFWKYKCASSNEIDQYFIHNNFFKLNIIINDFNINQVSSYNDKYVHQFISEELSFTFQPNIMKKQSDILFSLYEVDTDSNLFFRNDYQTEKFVFRGQDSIKETIFIDQKNENFDPLTIIIRSDNNQYQQTRTYTKVDELLAYFGGILQIYSIFFDFILSAYNEWFLNLELANKFYYTKKNEEIIKKKKYKKYKVGLTKQLSKNLTSGELPKDHMTDRLKLGLNSDYEFIKWYTLKYKQNKEYFTYTIQYIMYKLSFGKFFKSEYNQHLDLAIKKIEEQLNISNIIEKFQQIDRLLRILFNEEQLILFNFAQKDEIKLTKSNKIYNVKEFLSYYKRNKEKEEVAFDKILSAISKLEKDTDKKEQNEQIKSQFGRKFLSLLQIANNIPKQSNLVCSQIPPNNQNIPDENMAINQIKGHSFEVKIGNTQDKQG